MPLGFSDSDKKPASGSQPLANTRPIGILWQRSDATPAQKVPGQMKGTIPWAGTFSEQKKPTPELNLGPGSWGWNVPSS